MHTSLRLRTFGVTLLAVLALASLAPARARACGGFACSAAIPVVQVGEQVVYVIEADGSLTMSVRILYTGAAPEFAWILPVPETPTITLGTEALFTTVETVTRPTFSSSFRTDGRCREHPRCEYPELPDAGRFWSSDAAAVSVDAASADGGGPTIFHEGSLGPYETVVLGGGTTTEIIDWLTMRGYDIPASMAPLLDGYVAAGQRFVALRLRNDASSSDIQPITLGFGGVLPCLPIRLTAIATAPTLPITAYFLADARVASRNYSAIEPEYPSTLYFGGSYTNWVAGEAARLGGHAFATDFAGATPMARVSEVPDLADLATETDFFAFANALAARGYTVDPLTSAVLTRFVTPPMGVDVATYLLCALFGPATAASCGSALAFDPAGAVEALHEAIRQPRLDANTWLEARPYMTRLSTSMTAADMTLDPEFVVDPGLPDAPSNHTAVQVVECNSRTFPEDARVRLDIDDGRSLELSPARVSPTDAAYCAFSGGWLPGMGPAIDAGPVTPGGGGGCLASGGRPRPAPALGVCLILGVLVAGRRARRARA